ncbi:MAG: OsmC family protein [Bacteroidetes bacterium]|nr:OsmC family protein [Bacteroidota bacterium]
MKTMEVYFEGNKKVIANLSGHLIPTDQPVRVGGEGTAPSPFDLFLASLGTCAGIYIKSFCDNRKIPTDEIRILQHMDFNPHTGLLSKVVLDIKLPVDFPEKYKAAVIKAADQCKVKLTLMHPPDFEVNTSIIE